MSTTPTPQTDAAIVYAYRFYSGCIATPFVEVDLARSLECQASAWARSANEADDRLKVALARLADLQGAYDDRWTRLNAAEQRVARLGATLARCRRYLPSHGTHAEELINEVEAAIAGVS